MGFVVWDSGVSRLGFGVWGFGIWELGLSFGFGVLEFWGFRVGSEVVIGMRGFGVVGMGLDGMQGLGLRAGVKGFKFQEGRLKCYYCGYESRV